MFPGPGEDFSGVQFPALGRQIHHQHAGIEVPGVVIAVQAHPVDRCRDLCQAGMDGCREQIPLKGEIQQRGNRVEDQNIRVKVEHLVH